MNAPLADSLPSPHQGARVLITGMHGFTGRYLAERLRAAGYEVFGLVQSPGKAASSDMAHTVVADLCDRAALAAAMEQVQPQYVVHLAAIAFVAHSDVAAMYRVNIVGTRNLLESLLPYAPRAVLLASSANIYGNTRISPITEEVQPAPANDYAVSKLAMEHMARLWCERLPVTLVRPFNYTGVGQDENFLLPKIVAHYRRGERVIELGNLDVARDFSDVRDVVTSYEQLLRLAPVGETFNICSGQAYTLAEVLAMAAQIGGYEIDVRVNPAFARANEVKILVGSHQKLTQCIGSQQRIPLIETLRWMMQA